MTRRLALTTLAPAAAALLLLTSCGSSDTAADTASNGSSSTTTPTSASSTPTAQPSFQLSSDDGYLDISGVATSCTNSDENSLRAKFQQGTSRVSVEVRKGTGAVIVEGGPDFEGRVTSISVGDDGTVSVSGRGSAADDSASPTTFTLTGSCVGATSSTPGTSTGTDTARAACTNELITAAVAKGQSAPITVLRFHCARGWASGSYRVGRGAHAVDAAFLVQDVDGTWVVPKPLPCKDPSIPERILVASNCRVS